MTEHNRINEKIHDYWNKLRGEKSYPSENDINPEDIEDIWESCFLIKISNEEAITNGYRYTYLGKNLIEAFGDDLTNQDISSQLINPKSPPIAKHFNDIINNKLPIVDEDEFTNKSGMVIKYRSCMLPLGENEQSVNYIIGAMKWRAF